MRRLRPKEAAAIGEGIERIRRPQRVGLVLEKAVIHRLLRRSIVEAGAGAGKEIARIKTTHSWDAEIWNAAHI
jgi:hypothetical protein